MSVTNEELKATLNAQADSIRRLQDALDTLPDKLDAKFDKYLRIDTADQRLALIASRVGAVEKALQSSAVSRRAAATFAVAALSLLASVVYTVATIVH